MDKPKNEQFISRSPQARVRAVEFARVGEKECVLLTIKSMADAKEVQDWLTPDCTVISRTDDLADVLMVLEMHVPKERVLYSLSSHGEVLTAPKAKAKLADPWVWRGITSVVGQSLTFISGMLGKGDKVPLVGFAGLNLIANVINVTFGSQKKPDAHQLRFLADKTNTYLQNFGAKSLPSADSANKELPPDGTKKTSGEKTYEMLQKYSVTGGEIGLRTIGSINLAFPLTSVYKAFPKLMEGRWMEFYKGAKSQGAVFAFGIAMITGKVVSFFSKEPDPYNPKPPGIIDTIREKVTFPLSSWIEGGGSVYFAHHMFTKGKLNLNQKWVPQPLRQYGQVTDYLGGVGQTIFVGGYGIRLYAPYGTLEVDMKKLYAHVAEGLTHVPVEKRIQAATEIAQGLAEHFNKPDTHSVGTIFAGVSDALKTYHKADLHASGPSARVHSKTVAVEPVKDVSATPVARA